MIIRRLAVPIKPSMITSAPFIIGSCDNLTLDLTLSYGNGGHDWSAVNIIVSDTLINRNLSALQYFLDTKYKTPTSIPSTLIIAKKRSCDTVQPFDRVQRIKYRISCLRNSKASVKNSWRASSANDKKFTFLVDNNDNGCELRNTAL